MDIDHEGEEVCEGGRVGWRMWEGVRVWGGVVPVTIIAVSMKCIIFPIELFRDDLASERVRSSE